MQTLFVMLDRHGRSPERYGWRLLDRRRFVTPQHFKDFFKDFARDKEVWLVYQTKGNLNVLLNLCGIYQRISCEALNAEKCDYALVLTLNDSDYKYLAMEWLSDWEVKTRGKITVSLYVRMPEG